MEKECKLTWFLPETMKNIDVQELFLLSSTGQIEDCMGHLLASLLHSNGYLHVFMVAGWWVTVDFDKKYKVIWVEVRISGVPIHVKNKNLHIYSHLL